MVYFVDDLDAKADELSMLVASINDIVLRIKEQHRQILEIDVLLSDEPLIPTTEEMLDEYAHQEAQKEIIEKLGGIIYRQ